MLLLLAAAFIAAAVAAAGLAGDTVKDNPSAEELTVQ